MMSMLGDRDDGTFVKSIMLLISADDTSSINDDRSIISHNRSIITHYRSITTPSSLTISSISIDLRGSKIIDPMMTCMMDMMMEPPT